MQKPHRPLRVNKLPRVMLCRIAPAMKIFGILGLIFTMVPCLHQCKVYIKRKLRLWRAQKFNFLVSAKTEPTVVGQQTTPCLAAPYGQAIEIFKISELLIDMVPCLYQCNVHILRKLQVWRAQKCNFQVSAKTEPTVVGQQTTPCLAAPYLASNRNFQNFGDTYRHGTVFAPMQCLYCKEATGVDSLKYNLLVSVKTAPTDTGQQTTPCLAAPYWVKNRNFQNFWASFCHCTVFAPMQSLY